MSTGLYGIGQRLKEVRNKHGLTQPVLAAVIDVSDRTYKYYEQEKRELPALAAVKICERFNMNLEWLLTGKGPVEKSEKRLSQICSFAVLNERTQRKLDLSDEKTSKIVGFVEEQASQSSEPAAEIAKKYFDTL
ncbi:helix-turn-helix domain-containing protein [Falsihalocynthiibacter sp. S25ZX9]|jgi:DNA-binding XRE family transcriptional regulator|uniref:helix-turn-helix domain-containing protein n=1 Tax=Falsihalocynthiibacter sp. S25ZX9 TaxID=3240870 RepID=UPI00350F08CB